MSCIYTPLQWDAATPSIKQGGLFSWPLESELAFASTNKMWQIVQVLGRAVQVRNTRRIYSGSDHERFVDVISLLTASACSSSTHQQLLRNVSYTFQIQLLA